jgi:ATP-dependent DNA helicase RecG
MSDFKSLLKTTPKYISLLAKNGIVNVHDLLQYFPRTYEDRSTIRNLNELIFNEKGVTATKGKIIIKNVFMKGSKRIYDIKFVDPAGNTGHISLFNSGYMAARLLEGHRYVIVGKPFLKSGKMTFSHPDVVETSAPEEHGEKDEQDPAKDGAGAKDENITQTYNAGRIYPIYPELNGISPGWFAKKTWELVAHADQYVQEYLPEEFLKAFQLLGVVDTVKNMHYPETMELQKKAIQRIFFDRLLRVQLHALLTKASYHANYVASGIVQQDWEIVKNILATLPFQLTNAQKKVVKHVIDNMHDIKPMLRLLQGDVGSGKTVVAAISAYYSFKVFEGQSVFLAPLEVLANQHYRTLAKLLLPLGLRVELLT